MKRDTINISDIFFGSEQSKYAGIALFMTIIILCLIILFTGSKIPIGERFVFVIFILIISVPSILMSLFELTCIVTGGNSTTRWWCWLLAWFIAIIIILYCVMIIVSMLISMSNFEMANDRLDYSNEKNKVNKEDANIYAKNLLIENNYKEVSQKPPVHTTSHTSPSVMHEMQDMHVSQSPSVNTMSQQPSLSQKHSPSYSEPKHNVAAGNMLSFPQNSSDLSGFDTNDNYLTLDKANTPDINYSSEYKQSPNNSVSNYDGFDSSDKLSPF